MLYELSIPLCVIPVRCNIEELQRYKALAMEVGLENISLSMSEDGDDWDRLDEHAIQAVFAE